MEAQPKAPRIVGSTWFLIGASPPYGRAFCETRARVHCAERQLHLRS